MFWRINKTQSQAERRQRSHYPGFHYRNVFLVPNLLSISRIFWTIPAVILLAGEQSAKSDKLATLFLLIGFLTDVFDGLLARALKQISDLGKVLDPAIDKIVVLSIAFALTSSGRDPSFPLWLIGAMLLRDVVILFLASKVLREDHHLFISSWTGKTTTFMICTTILAYLQSTYFSEQLLNSFSYITLTLLIVSSIEYSEKYWSVRHKKYIERERRDDDF